jgi:hypothetical protein
MNIRNLTAVVLVVGIILAGCAADPQRLESVGKSESSRLAPPIKRFSSYANYELKPMVLSEAIQKEPDKVVAAGNLENALRAKLQPLLDQWKMATASASSGTLIIEPRLESLRIVSGGARFWAGAFAGDWTSRSASKAQGSRWRSRASLDMPTP